ncbi:hypothetical protein BX600DRAFT_179924 [Xylariales sp. PMI_506]|nr:hypothetical protein BX600DRAFT_179924 [Xylariales sp. PMI_506]
MNSHTFSRKRRLSGRDDAPVLVSQASPVAPAVYSCPVAFNQHELQILGEAAGILNCPLPQLLELDTSGRHQLVSSPIVYPAPKRLRMTREMSQMPSPEEAPAGLAAERYLDRSPEDSPDDLGISLATRGSRLASYFANVSFCPPCTTCEPTGYSEPHSMSQYENETKVTHFDGSHVPYSSTPWVSAVEPADVIGFDDSPPGQYLPHYPSLQPTQPLVVQPNTRGEEMTYAVPSLETREPIHPTPQQNGQIPDHTMNQGIDYLHTAYVETNIPRYSAVIGLSSPDGVGALVPRPSGRLDIVSDNPRPPPAKRGPFKSNAEREKTAETRRIGSCIRCRMQRIRCETNPDDKTGTCLTCSKVSNVKVWRVPCLRYKITDVKLFKPGPVTGHEWTRRWVEGIADDIALWASSETRNVCVTEGYTSRPVVLRVREFIPQDGDVLERSWFHRGEKKSVTVPPFAIVNLEEAKAAYTNHINERTKECCQRVISHKDKLILATYALAFNMMMDQSTDPKEKDLLEKALRLWMAIRMTTKSTYIVGQERLGMDANIMDDTSPQRGQIPLPPVMGAQIELVLIHQLQSKWRREMLDGLQVMIQANNHSTWFTTYLVTFILLHNCSLLCQHDAAYARKHGMESRFAREYMVKEYQLGANILLGYFHYCNKGVYPFSMECKDQDLKSLANLDDTKLKFVHRVRKIIDEQKDNWQEIRRNSDYEHDFYFTSQLFEQNWMPQPLMV